MEAARFRLAATAAGCLTGEAGPGVDVGGAGRDVDSAGGVWVLTRKTEEPACSTGTALTRLPSVPTASPRNSPSSSTSDKLARRMARDNQAFYVQDLAVSALARTRLAKSVHDAGWATLVRLLQERALRAGRSVVKVSRWFPSSPLCSACGFCSGSKPLEVRSWTCPQRGAAHDGDVNAVRNILVEGRKVAAGLAQTLNRSYVSENA
jgi:Putative transposase DNA-binding domain